MLNRKAGSSCKTEMLNRFAGRNCWTKLQNRMLYRNAGPKSWIEMLNQNDPKQHQHFGNIWRALQRKTNELPQISGKWKSPSRNCEVAMILKARIVTHNLWGCSTRECSAKIENVHNTALNAQKVQNVRFISVESGKWPKNPFGCSTTCSPGQCAWFALRVEPGLSSPNMQMLRLERQRVIHSVSGEGSSGVFPEVFLFPNKESYFALSDVALILWDS